MAITKLGVNIAQQAKKSAETMYSHTDSVIRATVNGISDTFVNTATKTQKTVLSQITDKVKSLILKEKIQTNTQAKSKAVRTKNINDIANKTKQTINTAKKALQDKCCKIKNKSVKIIDDFPSYFSKFKTSKFKSFEEFKKYIDNSPAVKFAKSLIQIESKKVERVVKQHYIENKNNFEFRRNKFNEAEKEFAEKLKDVKDALKKGVTKDINDKKNKLLSAKLALQDAKSYLEIASTFLIKSAKTAGIKTDKITM